MGLRYLLFQIRRTNDPMRSNEVAAFARMLGCPPCRIYAVDLIQAPPSAATLAAHDMVLIGGAGDYSVTEPGLWLEPALDAMRDLYALNKPTFASCWGFQALAAALGGKVITDFSLAEIGTLALYPTGLARNDPVFGHLPDPFYAHVGHQDTVVALPPDGVQLARSSRVANHAFCIRGKPIYATQFHAELRPKEMVARVRSYPQYIKKITGLTVEDFIAGLRETPEANDLLKRFVAHVFG